MPPKPNPLLGNGPKEAAGERLAKLRSRKLFEKKSSFEDAPGKKRSAPEDIGFGRAAPKRSSSPLGRWSDSEASESEGEGGIGSRLRSPNKRVKPADDEGNDAVMSFGSASSGSSPSLSASDIDTALLNVIETKLYSYDPKSKKFGARPGKRYDNQSGKANVRRVIERLVSRIPDKNDRMLTMNTLIEGTAKGKKLGDLLIDMAHVVPALELKELLLAMTERFHGSMDPFVREELIKSALQGIHDIVTTSAPDEEEITKKVRKLGSEDLEPLERMKLAQELVKRLNRSRGNLLPGWNNVNQYIGQLFDLPKMKNGEYVPWAVKRVLADIRLREKFGGATPLVPIDSSGNLLSSTSNAPRPEKFRFEKTETITEFKFGSSVSNGSG